jgi:hypothetical protein
VTAPLSDYERRCQAAATAQGLDPLTEALSAAGIEHAVEQTGGFCMVVTVTARGCVLAMTQDGAVEPWLLGLYTAKQWAGEGDTDGPFLEATAPTVGHLVERVRTWVEEQ